ncbi:MAG TPA: HEAT repeat domain-containing protein [Gemmatimonadales bacterium]|nr:HEAT repeat domain-containing protein [Gemmatimonadales bacterium]
MTATRPSPTVAAAGAEGVLVGAQVAEVIQGLVKALRAFQMYLPNNPIYQRAVGQIEAAFAPIWAATDELVLRVAETELLWEEQVVHQQHSKGESLAWMLYKDGLRTLTLRRGVEREEISRFLLVVNRARFLPADAGDDLLTLLWAEEFEYISYQFSEPFADAAVPDQAGGPPPGAAEERRARVEQEAPPKPAGIIDLDDFDSTLYFLEEDEISYVLREVQHEYQRDLRTSALAILFDVFEAQAETDIRAEILGILDTLFPHLLNARDFRAVAAILRETRQLRQSRTDLEPAHVGRLETFEAQLSEPAILRQLLQSLEEAGVGAEDADVAEVLRELRPTALETLVAWVPQLKIGPMRTLLEAVADRIAAAHSAEVLRLLRSPGSPALAGVVALCGRLKLQGAIPGLGELLAHEDAALRLAAVQALAEIGSPGALAHLDRAIGDADRAVRLAAVRVAGLRGHKGALRRVEAVVQGKMVGALDLTEKMAFFEAYGAIAGASGVDALEQILVPRGLLRRKEAPETRACAAIALGRTRTERARAILEQCATDKELMVRNAVTRALREMTA